MVPLLIHSQNTWMPLFQAADGIGGIQRQIDDAQRVQLQWNRAYLFTRGDGEFRTNSTAVPFRSGMLAFGFESERISIVSQGHCEYMYIDFGGLRAQELMLRFCIVSKNRAFAGLDGLIPLWNESLLRASKDKGDLAAESMLLFSFS